MNMKYTDGSSGGPALPDEKWALGNIVKLKKPYKPVAITEMEMGQAKAIALLLENEENASVPDGFAVPAVRRSLRQTYLQANLREKWTGFTHGIIVENLDRNAMGGVRVSLHLYDPHLGLLMMGPNAIPEYVDFSEDELELWKVAKESGYLTEAQKETAT